MNPQTLHMVNIPAFQPHRTNSPNYPGHIVYMPAPPSPHMMPVFPIPSMNGYRNERRSLKNTSPLRRPQALNRNKSPGPANSRSSQSSHCNNSKPKCEQVRCIDDVIKPKALASDSRYLTTPCHIDFTRVRINIQNSVITEIYKVTELPFQIPVSKRSNFMRRLIDSKQDSYHKLQPLGPANDAKYQVRALGEISTAVQGFLDRPRRRVLRSSKNLKANPLTRVAFQETSESNDSVDLSFDGKAMNRSDVFKIVDSFSQLHDDDDGDDDDQKDNHGSDDDDDMESPAFFTNRSILPPEMTNGDDTPIAKHIDAHSTTE
ncbi:LANO_0F14378g1_1 [Lachancea nothofagi CBS 11611]|uniref:LANO_0F14378g1_1 n=1 Tax=Lachancea nothofagi CBS 11611 TaxID=1266666 RepID=A0A1G4KC95_9SACH|nr:LANO_0F14378g1_1 [Lachancea nothofagi CBS 11611]